MSDEPTRGDDAPPGPDTPPPSRPPEPIGGPGERRPRRETAGAGGGRGPGEPDEPGTPAPGGPGRRARRARRRLALTVRLLVGTFLLGVVLLAGALVLGYLLVPIPEPNQVATAQSNVYLYADGSLLAKDGDVDRENITLAQVPKHTQHAVLAAEDRDFYNESGVDPEAMIRAGWNMLRGEGKQSGSTITQQYVKNYYLSQERTITRKLEEFVIAMKLDQEVGKNEILAGYLNTSYFGRNAYGLQAAARAYYDKPARELTVAEGAYLAAVVNSPSRYDVVANPDNRDRAVARWNYVLDGMVKEGWLTPADRRELEFPTPQPIEPPMSLSGQRGYLLEAVRTYLDEEGIVSESRLAGGGFRITTTLDRDKQEAFVAAVEEQLYPQLSEEREVDGYVRAGGTSIDPQTGDVVAMYGGVSFTEQYTNNATRTDYQAASTFKPFVYATAVAEDAETQDGDPIGPSTVYDGTSKREVVDDGRRIGYNPQNEGDHSHGDIPVSEAMDKSVNAVFAQMGVDVGPEKVRETLVGAGIPQDTPALANAGASISLGTATPSTLHLAQAYATLANHGERVDYRLVAEVTRGEEEVVVPESKPVRAMPRVAADAATALLRGVVEGGTGTAAQSAGRPAAGKTGTAEKDRAAWFAGYTPNLATVVAIMGQDPETGAQKALHGAAGLAKISGSGFPARIWGQYTGAALAGEPVIGFDLSPDVPEPSPVPSDGEDSEEDRQDSEDGTEPEAPAPTEAGGPGGSDGSGDTGDAGDSGTGAREDAPATGNGHGGGDGDEADGKPTGPREPAARDRSEPEPAPAPDGTATGGAAGEKAAGERLSGRTSP
ncbi:transglycosylase domain-containing protein [Streptomyces sp. WMMC1477]|uniref:transglycosylase domain-containing protein n=1 Tax=Streptomyces sp. WMMC1477 TaxID=3015155 RepID=UPI0022B5E85E|nr:transglycosylase domain-containing protein [Streptomyces sp. WMMC1477]MCZ7431418.1 transglycosylase domain-containing protein [Streptomyces sp. WMMC1477]